MNSVIFDSRRPTQTLHNHGKVTLKFACSSRGLPKAMPIASGWSLSISLVIRSTMVVCPSTSAVNNGPL